MTKRIHESGTISHDKTSNRFRVCLITEGSGSSADFPREFFVAENARALAGSLSFPNHPVDLDRPEYRDPLSAIGSIGDDITIEEHDGKLGFWGEYVPAKSKPQVAEYLNEYADKLGLSVYMDSDGHDNPATGKWVAESLTAEDPYKSVDLVVAAGRGGKFERQLAESLRRITEASATAGEKEVSQMEIKEVADKVDNLHKIVESLATTIEGKAKANLQVEVDKAAVAKIVESRLADYDKAVGLISEAKLTESQSASLRALALKGEDITASLEHEKKVLAEARAGLSESEDGDEPQRGRVAEYLGSGADAGVDKTKINTDNFFVPNFGLVN